jgi:TetR/AcrR family acrAB operon transcriptional repressor
MRRKKEEAEATKEDILKAAKDVFARKGFTAATLADIAEQAGITKGAIYWHFDNKSELYQQVLAHGFMGYYELMAGILTQDMPPMEKIRKAMTAVLVAFEQDEEYRASVGLLLFNTEASEEMQPFIARVVEFNEAIYGTLVGLIEQGIASKEIDPGIDPGQVAYGLMGFVHGVEVISILGIGNISLEENAESMVEFQLRGLGKGKEKR